MPIIFRVCVSTHQHFSAYTKISHYCLLFFFSFFFKFMQYIVLLFLPLWAVMSHYVYIRVLLAGTGPSGPKRPAE